MGYTILKFDSSSVSPTDHETDLAPLFGYRLRTTRSSFPVLSLNIRASLLPIA